MPDAKQATREQIQAYNSAVRERAFAESIHFGVETPESRESQAAWCKRIRSEYPLSEYGETWGEHNDI